MHEENSLSPTYEKECETLKKNNHKNSQNSSDLKCEIHNPIKDGEEILINSFPILNQLNENQKNAHVIKSIQENQSLSKQSFIIDGKIQDSHLDKESDGAFDEKTYYHGAIAEVGKSSIMFACEADGNLKSYPMSFVSKEIESLSLQIGNTDDKIEKHLFDKEVDGVVG